MEFLVARLEYCLCFIFSAIFSAVCFPLLIIQTFGTAFLFCSLTSSSLNYMNSNIFLQLILKSLSSKSLVSLFLCVKIAKKYLQKNCSFKFKQGGENYVSGKHRCVNKCCSLNPCLNGGVCQEICDTHSTRFNCTCPEIYTGQRCGKISQITYPRSCKDIAKNGASAAGNYNIFNSADEPFSVYCDLQSEPGFVWALIQSFSIANKATFKDKGFGTDFPVNDNNDNKDWNSYRLSLARMQSLFQYSTHLRVTCNFPTDGLRYTDYVLAVLRAGHDIFGNWNQDCKLFEYINIRGIHCSNCTADTRMESDKAWFVNSFKSKDKGCDFDGSSGAVDGENNFGMYHSGAINTNHRCSSSSSSTTQYWFGVKHEQAQILSTTTLATKRGTGHYSSPERGEGRRIWRILDVFR